MDERGDKMSVLYAEMEKLKIPVIRDVQDFPQATTSGIMQPSRYTPATAL